MTMTCDVVIVGAGVIGAAAAWALAGTGPSTMLIEQHHVAHTLGSSHGGSRIFRYAHPTADYAAMMPEIETLWRQLERDSGQRLLLETGCLFVGQEGDPFLAASQTAMATLDTPFHLLDAADLARRFPQFRSGRDAVGLLDPHGGILAASDVVAAMVNVATARGCTLLEQARVESITPQADGVLLTFHRAGQLESVWARRAILCAGPWAPRLLDGLLAPALPLKVTQQQVAYFAVRDANLWAAENCPVYIFTADPHVYGFPIFERAGCIKVAREFVDTIVDPDAERRILSERLADLSATIAERLTGVDPAPVHVDACLYTEAPNRDFFVDYHPHYPQIVIAAGFSGRGFKFGVGMGRLLAHLAQTEPEAPPHRFWLPCFAIGAQRPEESGGSGADLFQR